MKLTFQINYRTEYGQTMCVLERGNTTLGWTDQHPLRLQCQGQDFWTNTIEVGTLNTVCYTYAILREDGTFIFEPGEERTVDLLSTKGQVILRDLWQAPDYEQAFHTTVFMSALFHRAPTTPAPSPRKRGNIRFTIDMAQVLPTQGVAIMGNIPALGNWDPDKKLILSDKDFPIWRGEVEVSNTQVVEYKYCIYDLQSGHIIDLEWGENRQIWGIEGKTKTIIQNDRAFRRTQPRWKGAGVAVPVFSLRTKESFGIGEFQDLKKLAQWAAMTGMKMIQTLPINDTTLTHTYTDSYPYNAVSVFALHPIYLNIEKMGKLSKDQLKTYHHTQDELNALPYADYQHVYDEKMKYFQLLFANEGKETMKSADYQAFYRKNAEWLEPYTDFLCRRDGQPSAFYAYLQYHADRQLSDAVAYAHSLGVAMKGDIPIGISPDSVDAYTHPELFHLTASAGAPPDDFSTKGQNWGFPTYNWDKMSEDNYQWWRKRFTKMQDYFDAYRIDHILGFFRIWQMRKSDVWGLCGHFSPALPYTLQELWDKGVKLDEDRMVRPYIRSNFLREVLGEVTDVATKYFLRSDDGYVYYFHPDFNSQRKIDDYINAQLQKPLSKRRIKLSNEAMEQLREGLLLLSTEVLMVRDQTNEKLLHPRISINLSRSFQELYDDQKQVLMEIYNDYFFRRHNAFWRESAMKKLPTLIHSTGMLCCGEDLGMVPDCVPSVMHDLQILSLEIQRMPKNPSVKFQHPADAPYLSVCTTGTHDTNPLRAWWEEDKEATQLFYNQQLGWWGEAPHEMTPEIAAAIITQHMYSPAMWVILPLQDWLAIDGDIRLHDQHAERINVPANPKHFWKYRMHLTLEELMDKHAFNERLANLTAR